MHRELVRIRTLRAGAQQRWHGDVVRGHMQDARLGSAGPALASDVLAVDHEIAAAHDAVIDLLPRLLCGWQCHLMGAVVKIFENAARKATAREMQLSLKQAVQRGV